MIRFRACFSRVLCMIVQFFRRQKLGKKGSDILLGCNIKIIGKGILQLGDKSVIGDNSTFCFNPINDNIPEIVLGKGVYLGKNNEFGCSERIVIEDDVITAPYVHITDRDHCFEDINTPIMHQPTKVKGPVVVGAGSWLGFGVQIMSGVRIGKNCVIAAGAVVTKNIPDYCIAGGNPAKILKRYNHDTKQWERVCNTII